MKSTSRMRQIPPKMSFSPAHGGSRNMMKVRIHSAVGRNNASVQREKRDKEEGGGTMDCFPLLKINKLGYFTHRP